MGAHMQYLLVLSLSISPLGDGGEGQVFVSNAMSRQQLPQVHVCCILQVHKSAIQHSCTLVLWCMRLARGTRWLS